MNATQTQAQDRARAEHLVDRVLGILLPGAVQSDRRTIIRLVHQARAARKAGDPGRALAILSNAELASAPRDLACWAYGEWIAAARQVSLPPGALLYRGATGQAAALEPDEHPGLLRVVATLGLAWESGCVLSRACLRGLTPLHPAPAVSGGGA